MNVLKKQFKLKENKTTVRTEMIAGVTTFMTMSYIIIVNPSILATTGMDSGALLTATCVAAALGCIFMALFANYPIGLAPGMGLNAYFAFTIVGQYGYSWQVALAAVFIEGLLFILLSAVNVREALFNSIPYNMKKAVSVGVGMFIAFIGLQNCGLIVANPDTLVALGDATDITNILAMIGIVISLVLVIKKIRGALFLGILITWGLGIVCQLMGLYVVDMEAGAFSLIPSAIMSMPPSIAPVALKLDFHSIHILDFITVILALLFVDLFDTIGTLIGVSDKAGFMDENGKLPRIKGALFADAAATTCGALLGTSTVTSFVESSTGVADGGRTGLTAIFTGILFLAALFFAPIFTTIPSFATTPAMIIVGLFMAENVSQIDFADYTEGFPAFICILMMVVTYSISEGLVFGMLSYIFLKIFSGRRKELNPIVIVIGIFFMLKLFM